MTQLRTDPLAGPLLTLGWVEMCSLLLIVGTTQRGIEGAASVASSAGKLRGLGEGKSPWTDRTRKGGETPRVSRTLQWRKALKSSAVVERRRPLSSETRTSQPARKGERCSESAVYQPLGGGKQSSRSTRWCESASAGEHGRGGRDSTRQRFAAAV